MTIFLERLLHYLENHTSINRCTIHINRSAGYVQVSKINNTSLFIWNTDIPIFDHSDEIDNGLMILANIKAVELNKISLSMDEIYDKLVSEADDKCPIYVYDRKVVNT